MKNYNKCSFCTNKPSTRFKFLSFCVPSHIDDYLDYDGDDDDYENYEFHCAGYDHFVLDGDKVIKTAKELGISITDLLELIKASST